MSRSSIFSSESTDIRPRDHAWRAALQVVLIAAVVFVFGEGLCRVLLKEVGRRWEYWHPIAATKFEFLRVGAEQGRPIKTLVVGDSTGAADFDTAVLERELGPKAWNAAWSGNFPMAFEQTTLPLLSDDRLPLDWIVASFIPSGFAGDDRPTSSEAGLLGSTFVQKRTTRQTGEYVYLARLRSAWPFLMNDLVGQKEPPTVTRFGFRSNPGRATAEMIASEPVQPPVEALNARRLHVLNELIALSRQREARLLVVIPPSLTKSPARIAVARLLSEFLAKEEAAGRLRYLDLMRPAFLENSHFADVNHLNTGGAALFSAEIARAIRQAATKAGAS